MKVEDVPSLRASVATGVWSSSPGVNQVLQKAWEDKQADEKIVLLFSIPHQ